VAGVLVFAKYVAPKLRIPLHELSNSFFISIFFLFKVDNDHRFPIFRRYRGFLVVGAPGHGVEALIVGVLGLISASIVD